MGATYSDEIEQALSSLCGDSFGDTPRKGVVTGQNSHRRCDMDHLSCSLQTGLETNLGMHKTHV